jgi:hypothetical protein
LQNLLHILSCITMRVNHNHNSSKFVHNQEIRYSSALSYGLDDRGFEYRKELGIFLFTTVSTLALGPTQPPILSYPILWVQGALSLRLKWPGVKLTTHLYLVPRSNNAWSCTSTPLYAFKAWCSVKAQGQLYPFNLQNQELKYMSMCIHIPKISNLIFPITAS